LAASPLLAFPVLWTLWMLPKTPWPPYSGKTCCCCRFVDDTAKFLIGTIILIVLSGLYILVSIYELSVLAKVNTLCNGCLGASQVRGVIGLWVISILAAMCFMFVQTWVCRLVWIVRHKLTPVVGVVTTAPTVIIATQVVTQT
jgi:hypothetical protein